MDELWRVIAELGMEMHPARISALVNKLKTIDSPQHFQSLESAFGPYSEHILFTNLESAWKRCEQVTAEELAAGLLAASATSQRAKQRGKVQLVWTGPSTALVPIRHTEQVLCELLGAARERLFMVSFVAYDLGSVITAMKVALGRGVRISLLLESSAEHGGKVSYDSVRNMKTSLPEVNIYIWDKSKKEQGDWSGGAVHAKCAVADSHMAFVTSANLTGAAMERNMECGVLVTGGNLPKLLHAHLDALITTEIVRRV